MRPPSIWATINSCNPIGPQPITSTVSPAATRAFCTALTIVLIGSMNVASSKLTLSGSATIPRSATQGIAFTYSPNPPPFGVTPAVNPVDLYSLHCENIRRSQKKHSPQRSEEHTSELQSL